MLLIYQNKNNKNYSYIEQSYPSFTTEIGEINKRGQILLYVLFYTKGKVFVLSSWDDYYVLAYKLNRSNIFDLYNSKKRAIKLSLSYKLIILAHKLRK